MDFEQNLSRDVLRQILANIPHMHGNEAVLQYVTNELAKQEIQAIPYTYTVPFSVPGAFNALAAGATLTTALNIQADADFLILNQTFSANQLNASYASAAELTAPNVSIFMNDTGSGNALMDNPVPVAELFGNARLPFVLPQPRRLAAKATLQVQAINNDPANGFNISLAFNGVKLYKFN
jgi:hypothetical protein